MLEWWGEEREWTEWGWRKVGIKANRDIKELLITAKSSTPHDHWYSKLKQYQNPKKLNKQQKISTWDYPF